MCGILCCFSPTDDKLSDFTTRLNSIKHRGPDETKIKIVKSPNLTTFTCGFNRLAISDVLSGSQPFEHEEWVHVHNGEFYKTDKTYFGDIYSGEYSLPLYNSSQKSDSYHLKDMTWKML